jgi:hypothetical protein
MMNAYRYAILWHCPKNATPLERVLRKFPVFQRNA